MKRLQSLGPQARTPPESAKSLAPQRREAVVRCWEQSPALARSVNSWEVFLYSDPLLQDAPGFSLNGNKQTASAVPPLLGCR